MGAEFGLIFDVDGVISDTETLSAEVAIKVFTDLFGLADVVKADFEAGLGRGAEAYMRAAGQAHGLTLTDEQTNAAAQLRQDNFIKALSENPLPPYPGVLDLMNAAMKHNDFAVAIATSSTREKSEAVLSSAKIQYQQIVYVSGDVVKNKKPHPELFLRAVEQLKIPAPNCVVIEDTPSGVKAAKAANCKCIAVTNTTIPENLQQADMIVGSLTDVSVETLLQLLGAA